jgi:Na+-transporting NADH:ubiquinone oxidoreductase subunit NqrD
MGLVPGTVCILHTRTSKYKMRERPLAAYSDGEYNGCDAGWVPSRTMSYLSILYEVCMIPEVNQKNVESPRSIHNIASDMKSNTTFVRTNFVNPC